MSSEKSVLGGFFTSSEKSKKLDELMSSLDILERYNTKGEDFLDRLVTGVETWVRYLIPETKTNSVY